jgi:hypothetical protein
VSRQVYIQWAHFQRRPVALQAVVPFDLYFADSAVFSHRLRLIDYVIKAARTWSLLRRDTFDVVWIATPPVFLIYLCFLFRSLSRRKFSIVIDCHNGTFLKPWGTFPWLGRLLKAADQCVVHTPYARVFLERHGVAAECVTVLEDLPPQVDLSPHEARDDWRRFAGPYVVIATSFRADQPVELFIDLARRLTGVTVVVTGDHTRRCLPPHFADAPENLVLTGFLETPVFDALLCGADALVGLTLRENAIVSVAAEGLGFIVPLVLSDTPALRAHFPMGAVFVDTSSAQAVAEGVVIARARGDDLRAALAELRAQRIATCRRQAEDLLVRLRSRAGRSGAGSRPAASAALIGLEPERARTGPAPSGFSVQYAEASVSARDVQDW